MTKEIEITVEEDAVYAPPGPYPFDDLTKALEQEGLRPVVLDDGRITVVKIIPN